MPYAKGYPYRRLILGLFVLAGPFGFIGFSSGLPEAVRCLDSLCAGDRKLSVSMPMLNSRYEDGLTRVARHAPDDLILNDDRAPLGAKALAAAVAIYRQMLMTYPRERAPLQWAMTQNNLGNALVALSQCKRDGALICEALSIYIASWKAISLQDDHYASHVAYNVSKAVRMLQEHGDQQMSQACLAQHHPILEGVHKERMHMSE